MQIYCPKCKTGYDIEPDLIPENGRKLRCVRCREVFVCRPEDLKDGASLRNPEPEEKTKQELPVEETVPADKTEPDKAPEPQENKEQNTQTDKENKEEDSAQEEAEEVETGKEINDIFKRLSVETEALFKEENSESAGKKLWQKIKKFLGLHRSENYKYYYLLFLVFGTLFLYYARYDIVRTIPAVLPLYEKLGIKAKIPGEGLSFQNISRRDFEDDFINKTEVKGFINNTTDKSISIPRIRVELLDKNADSLQIIIKRPNIDVVVGKGKVPFTFVLEKPSTLTKYIFLTFTDEEIK